MLPETTAYICTPPAALAETSATPSTSATTATTEYSARLAFVLKAGSTHRSGLLSVGWFLREVVTAGSTGLGRASIAYIRYPCRTITRVEP